MLQLEKNIVKKSTIPKRQPVNFEALVIPKEMTDLAVHSKKLNLYRNGLHCM